MNYVYKLTLQSAVPGCLRGQAWGILSFSRGPLPFLPVFSWPLSDLPALSWELCVYYVCPSSSEPVYQRKVPGSSVLAQDGGAPLESILHQPEAVGGFPEQRPLGTRVLAPAL